MLFNDRLQPHTTYTHWTYDNQCSRVVTDPNWVNLFTPGIVFIFSLCLFAPNFFLSLFCCFFCKSLFVCGQETNSPSPLSALQLSLNVVARKVHLATKFIPFSGQSRFSSPKLEGHTRIHTNDLILTQFIEFNVRSNAINFFNFFLGMKNIKLGIKTFWPSGFELICFVVSVI